MTADEQITRLRTYPAGYLLLAELADHLDTIAPEKFNLGTWKTPCGTTACAIGHMMDLPWAHHLGWRWTSVQVAPGSGKETPIPYWSTKGKPYGANIWTSLADFFDITEEEVIDLFSLDNAPRGDKIFPPRLYDPKVQATYMRQFLTSKGYPL